MSVPSCFCPPPILLSYFLSSYLDTGLSVVISSNLTIDYFLLPLLAFFLFLFFFFFILFVFSVSLFFFLVCFCFTIWSSY